jgi:hypothetical protein
MHKKIPSVPSSWQDFILSVLFQLCLPILPILLEFWLTGKITEQSVTLVSALYSISVGVSSRSRLFFGMGIVAGIVFSVAFGVSAGGQPPTNCKLFSTWAISAVFVIHACERWNLHVIEEKPYWSF